MVLHVVSHLQSPLYRLVQMHVIKLALQCNLTRLKHECVHSYRNESYVFNVLVTNEEGEKDHMIDNEKATWGTLWNEEDNIYNAILSIILDLEHL